MKTYNNLLEKSLTPQMIMKCMLDAADGKMRRREILKTFQQFDNTYELVVRCARDPNYYPRDDNKHQVADGTNHKIRTIEKPMFCPEQILHHVIVEPFREVLMNGLYEQVYGCIPATIEEDEAGNIHITKYGPHAAVKRLRKWAQVKTKIYVAELDVHHAYDSVNLDILMEHLKEVIKDDAWLTLVDHFIRGKENKQKGLVLGHYTSPWLFNFYLKKFDHYAASLDGIQYLRFADNLFLVGRNKRKVHRAVYDIAEYLRQNLRLELNKSAQVYRFEYVDRYGKTRGRAVNALGFVIHHNRVTLRKRLLKAIRRKANRISRKEHVTWHDGASMISRLGFIHKTDTHEYYKAYIKPKINIKRLKQKVRNYNLRMQHVYLERRRIINDGLEKSKWLSGK